MDLKDIGFYTLSDERIMQTSDKSPLYRCELIITDACNFKCPYCRGVKPEYRGTMPTIQALVTIRDWAKQGLKNIRFSGGEPCLHKGLPEMVRLCKDLGVERIAISTNGSMSQEKYDELLEAGVNDFSISLDACCASIGDKMAGGIEGAWEKVVANIKYLSAKTYVTVGIVLTPDNIGQLADIVVFADSLGVADIRIISSAQFNKTLTDAINIPKKILDKHPILAYRVRNLREDVPIRGICGSDNNRCPLVMDDIASINGFHFPCIIYLREGGAPIGQIGENTRAERLKWAKEHDTHKDPICSGNCLDVCVQFNNQFRKLRGE